MGDLTTLANVKTRLGLTETTTDPLLSSLITEVSTLAQTFIGHSLTFGNYSETFDGAGQRAFTLSTTPVTSVTSVTIGAQVITQVTDLVSSGFIATPQSVLFRGVWVQPGIQNVRINYQAGYTTIPADLEMSVIDLICLIFAEHNRMGQKSINMGSQSISYLTMNDGIPPRIKAVWSAYQRWGY